jgi:hypothetical protein
MTQGYLVYAYNNEEIDYGLMSIVCCLLIKKHLKINTTALATNQDTLDWMIKTHGEYLVDKAFDKLIITHNPENSSARLFHDSRYTSKKVPYYNTNRSDSFTISPFDETVLLDADFLVLDNSLDCVWNSAEDILVNKSVRDLNHVENLKGFDKRFNDTSIPLYWATCMYFKKTERAKYLFSLMKFIKQNYRYYQQLYKFNSSGYFRNDYALSIAVHMMNAQLEENTVKSLPIPQLMFATEHDDLIDFTNGTAIFVSEAEQGNFKLHKVCTNVHLMNKWSIGRMSQRIIEYAIN